MATNVATGLDIEFAAADAELRTPQSTAPSGDVGQMDYIAYPRSGQRHAYGARFDSYPDGHRQVETVPESVTKAGGASARRCSLFRG